MPPVAAQRALREASLELARLRRIRGASHRTWRRIARARGRLALASAFLAAASTAEPAAAAGTPLFRHGPTVLVQHGLFADPDLVDIDGDGDLDAFVGNLYGETVLFRNTGGAGAPAFAAPSTNPFGLADVGPLAAPVFVDIDADGDIDAFIGRESGQVVFFQNTGSATVPAFGAPATNPFGLTNVNGHAPAFVDIDADGDLDGFFNRPGGAIWFAPNTGSAAAPAFAPAATNPFGLYDPIATLYPDLTFADIDGDGDLDAFVGIYPGGGAFLFVNSGSASAPVFAAPVANPFGLKGMFGGTSPAFGDLDGDGDLDAYLADYFGFAAPCSNTGSASAPAFACSEDPFGLAFPMFVGGAWRKTSPALADLDGDGDLDAFVGHYDGARFFWNTGSSLAPAFAPAASQGLPTNQPHSAAAFADVDGDGDLDALVGDRSGIVRFAANTGSAAAPAFATASTAPFAFPDVGEDAAPTFADIDGDGDVDVFVGNNAGNTLFFQNTGVALAPAFAAASTNPFGLAGVASVATPRFADLDGDGDLDAFVGAGDGRARLFWNTGTTNAPAFAPPQIDTFGLTGVGSEAAADLADLDGDGDLDALFGASYAGLRFFENVAIDEDACRDGLDNDGDGRIDFGDDPGCASAADTSELGTPQCDHGLDDDGDGLVDSADPHCTGPLDDREAPTQASPGCGLGPELALLVPLLAAVRRRRGSYTARACPSASPTPRPTSSSSGAP